MAATYANHNEIIDTGGDESITVTVPASLAAGDLWVVIVFADTDGGAGDDVTIPTGWNGVSAAVLGQSAGGYGVVRAFWKIAGASESSVAFTGGVNWYDVVAYSIRITGAHASSPLDAEASSVSNTSDIVTDAPNITVAEADSLALLWNVLGNSATLTAPTGTTIRDSRLGEFLSGGFATEARNAGAYAPGNWTHDPGAPRMAQTFSIKPAAAAGAATLPSRSVIVGQAVHRAFSY